MPLLDYIPNTTVAESADVMKKEIINKIATNDKKE